MTPDVKPEPADKPAAKPRAKRRWYQFSLWSMFVWVTVIGVGLAVGVLWVGPAQRQRAAVQMVERVGGSVRYTDPPTDEGRLTTWLRDLLPRDYFDEVKFVVLDGTGVTDADLGSLGGLTQLHRLLLSGTQVADTGLLHLSGHMQLRELVLDGSQVTDAGLLHLSRLAKLQELWLYRTQVTDAGVAALQKALPSCRIFH